jgi:hypothetical protein
MPYTKFIAATVKDRDFAKALIHASVKIIRAYGQALRLSRERDDLVARRRVVETESISHHTAGRPTPEVHKFLNEALDKIPAIVITGTGGPRSAFYQQISGQITSLGLQVVSSQYDSPSRDAPCVKCELLIKPYDRGNPSWMFYEWNGTFQLSQGDTVLAASSISGQEGHPVEATARAKAQAAGEDALAEEVGRKISQAVFGEE